MPLATPPAAVLFDFDGTLIDSAPDIVACLNETLAAFGRPPVPFEEGRRMIGRGAPVLIDRGFARSGGPPEDPDAALGLFLERYMTGLVAHTTLYPGALDILGRLADRGVPVGLVTNKPIRPTRAILDHFGLDTAFGVVLGGDSVPAKKPAPDMIVAAAESLGVDPAAAWVVGDSDNDVGAARAAGAGAIAVTFGYSMVPAHALGADHVIEDLPALGSLL